MLALSPPSWFPTFGWPSDDHINRWPNLDDSFKNYNELDWSKSFPESSTSRPEVEIDGPKNLGVICDDTPELKKMSHNANERDRRKKLNTLYSSLRSLLPLKDQKLCYLQKKLSIPATVSLVLEYIPELQKQVERLGTRKEEILSKMSRKSDVAHLINKKRVSPPSEPSISLTQVDDGEMVIQICCTSDTRKIPFSEVVLKLEEEGLGLLNASSFSAVGDKVFYTLHLQVKDRKITECEECGRLRKKLLSLYQHKEELYPSTCTDF